MLNFIKKNVWILILIMSFLTVPQALTTQAQLKLRVLITGLAIDKQEDKYLVTAQVIIPSQSTDGSGTAKISFVTVESLTIAESINKVAFSIGKTAGISHLTYVIVGNSFDALHLPTELDYFVRSRLINNALVIMLAQGSAKDEMLKTQQFDLGTATNFQKIYLYKQTASNTVARPLQEFVNETLTKSGCGVISYINIETQDDIDASSNSGNSEKGNEQLWGRIKYLSPIAYYKNGYKVGNFETENEIKGMMLFERQCKEMNIVVQNVNGGQYQNATLNIYARDKKSKIKSKIIDGVPNIDLSVSLTAVEFEEIINDEINDKIYSSSTKILTEDVKAGVESQLSKYINDCYEKAKQDNVDIFHLLDALYRYNTKEYHELKKQNDDDAILQNIKLNVKVKIDTSA